MRLFSEHGFNATSRADLVEELCGAADRGWGHVLAERGCDRTARPTGSVSELVRCGGGTLRLQDLSNFEYLAIGDAAAGLDVGAMDLDGNNVQQLEPTHLVVGSSGTISITNDSGLSTCQVDAFATTQGGLGWTGTLVNTGNTGC